jgi:branched-chain amino acid transport system substrate-binding protein
VTPRRIPARSTGLAIAFTLLSAAGCGGGHSSAGGSADPAVRIGLITALTGSNQATGTDIRDGFQLYLDTHGGKLGGHPVDLSVADEGDDPKLAGTAAGKMIADRSLALVGLVDTDTVAEVAPLTVAARIPLLSTGSAPTVPDVSHVWTTSFRPEDVGASVAGYLRTATKGPVFALGPDSPAGHDELRGFTDAFKAAGGTLAGPGGGADFLAPATADFGPELGKIKTSGARAVYCYFSGQPAVDFVKQYALSDVHNLPLYAAGPVTEGAALRSEESAAANIYSVMNYAPDSETSTNRVFVADWGTRHSGQQPSAFAAASYDAAAVLDQAIAHAGPTPTAEQVNAAIAQLGELDSPRGVWQFGSKTHSPIQKWYLRKVQRDGNAWANVKLQDLATLGQ